MKISFCQYNTNAKEVIEILNRNYPQLNISINRCIYSCGDCADKYIARINGELMVGNTAQQLVDKIIAFSIM